MRMRILLAALTLAAAVPAAHARQRTVRLGVVKALTSTATYIAIEKGYFSELGIKVETEDLDTTALVPLAQNQLQLVEAGLTELLYKYPWPARDPNGRANVASLLDIQAWYVKAGLSQAQFPAERIVSDVYVDHAVEKLGPFTVENKASPLAGCR
jgi:hypothetical protein